MYPPPDSLQLRESSLKSPPKGPLQGLFLFSFYLTSSGQKLTGGQVDAILSGPQSAFHAFILIKLVL
jgi:hypothetical protein